MPRVPTVTDSQLRRLKAADKAYRIGCGQSLFLAVTPAGRKNWQIRYRRSDGSETLYQFGSYPEISLVQARDKTDQVFKQLSQGIDPIYEKRVQVEALRRKQLISLQGYSDVARPGRGKVAQSKVSPSSALSTSGTTPTHIGRFKRSSTSSSQPIAVEIWPEGSFAHCAQLLIQSKSAEWKNAKHTAQWSATLANYAYPVIGHLPVQALRINHVLQVLEPIWISKMETANRLRGRIESVLDYATARGLRDADNPARWKGSLQNILPNPKKSKRVQSHAAMPYLDVPSFMALLQSKLTMGSAALQLLILSATRSGEIRGAKWAEFLQVGLTSSPEFELWVIPASRMKAGREHRVPLSAPARQLLQNLWKAQLLKLGITAPPKAHQWADLKQRYVFASQRDTPLSDMTLTQFMRREELDFTAHGFRSSFRDWCAEQTNYPREVCEHALAHQLPDKVEAAYLRTDYLEKRKLLMEDWGRFLVGY
jgi:integrase